MRLSLWRPRLAISLYLPRQLIWRIAYLQSNNALSMIDCRRLEDWCQYSFGKNLIGSIYHHASYSSIATSSHASS